MPMWLSGDSTNFVSWNTTSGVRVPPLALKIQIMTSRDFAYWLQGFFEISNPQHLTQEQTDMVKKHLNLVFKHEIDPSMGGPEHQKELNDIHNGPLEQTKQKEYVKATLKELGEQYGFEVYESMEMRPPDWKPGWKYSSHGWYDPAQGTPRC